MTAALSFPIEVYTPDSVTWVAIKPPFECSTFTAINTGTVGVELRPDTSDATRKYVLKPGEGLPTHAGKFGRAWGWLSIKHNATIFFVRAVSGSGEITVFFA